MTGAKDEFVVELLKQTEDKTVLNKGPTVKGFWIKKWSTKVKLKTVNQQILVRHLYPIFREYFCIESHAYLRIYPYYYGESNLRTSFWAWVYVKGQLFHCHVEAAHSYV